MNPKFSIKNSDENIFGDDLNDSMSVTSDHPLDAPLSPVLNATSDTSFPAKLNASGILRRTQRPQSTIGGLFGSAVYDPTRRNPARTVDNYASDSDRVDWANEITGRRIKYEDFTTIDWLHDLAKDRLRVRRLLETTGYKGRLLKIWDGAQAWIVVFLIGGFAGIFAGFISISSDWLNDLKDGYCSQAWYLRKSFCCMGEDSVDCKNWVAWKDLVSSGSTFGQETVGLFFYALFAVLFSTTAAYLVQQYAPYAAGSGIAEVKTILGGFIIRKFLGWWTLIIKTIGLSLSVASGLCLGKEGPLVHVACCLGNIIPRMFKKYANNEAKKREILSAASAASVAVAFGAPIGGVLFSLEEVSYYFPLKTLWRSFFCAMVAAVSLRFMDPLRSGRLVMFEVTYTRAWHFVELGFFVLIGLFGGFFGTFFIRANLAICRYRMNSFMKNWPIMEVASVALFTSILCYFNEFAHVNLSELIARLFSECDTTSTDPMCDKKNYTSISLSLLWVVVLKMILTVFTIGIKVPAGLYVPSMAIGACFGRVVGNIVQSIYQSNVNAHWFASCQGNTSCITPGLYAMAGAAAALGGVTRMTVSLVTIMFELTGALDYVLPIMISVMVAKWVGDAFGKEGIYDGMIKMNGYPFLEENGHSISAPIEELMSPFSSLRVLDARMETVSSIEEILHETQVNGFPIVNCRDECKLVGFIGRAELKYAIEQAKKNRVMGSDLPCVFLFESYRSRSFKLSRADLGGYRSPVSPVIDVTLGGVDNVLPMKTMAMQTLVSDEPEGEYVDLSPWIDKSPMTLSPMMPVEVVVDLFKKMGLRYALISYQGRLEGIVTKKDLLKHLNEVIE